MTFSIRRIRLLLTLALGVFSTGFRGADAEPIDVPKSLDDRVTVELFASEPDVKTITSLTVDSRGRVFVVENHTHFRPDDYDGPEFDRIRMLVDTTGNGRADKVTTFFTGTKDTMSIAVHPTNGWMYVATRRSIFRIRDKNNDGVAEEKQVLVQLETKADYPHNGLSGFAFSFSGGVRFGMGQNSGENGTLKGKKGIKISLSNREGGLFSCSPTGENLKRVARGFWNPFHFCFDTYGRLFLGDNDPGNRPPCRFLYIVQGGDYGYKRRALEPFIAVNGEMPGSLPMTSSTGESPTGMVCYESDHFPSEYRGEILSATWGEHRIDRYHLVRSGGGFKTITKPFISGGEHFRPAGMAVAPDGSIYVGDWADRSYPLHGKGRIWHIKAKHPKKRKLMVTVEERIHAVDRTIRENAARELIHLGKPGITKLHQYLSDPSPRVRSLAMAALMSCGKMTKEAANKISKDPVEAIREQAARTLPLKWVEILGDRSMAVRAELWRRESEIFGKENRRYLEAALVPKEADPFVRQAKREMVKKLPTSEIFQSLRKLRRDKEWRHAYTEFLIALRDVSHDRTFSPKEMERLKRELHFALIGFSDRARLVAIEWIGAEEMKEFKENLVEVLANHATTPELFEATLAGLALLDGVMAKWDKGKTGEWWKKAANSQQYVEPLLNRRTPSKILRQGLLYLPAKHPSVTLEVLIDFLNFKDLELRLEVVRKMRALNSSDAAKQLRQMATSSSVDENLRAEAIIGLQSTNAKSLDVLVRLACDSNRVVSHEALRSLKGATLTKSQVALISKTPKPLKIPEVLLEPVDKARKELVARLLASAKKLEKPAAKDLTAWLKLLEGKADARAGQRIFFHPKGPGCANCHRIDGRGKSVGPGFIRMEGRLPLTRARMVEAILQPSKEVDPGFVPWTIVTTKGKVGTGIFYKHGNGYQMLIDSSGKIQKYKASEILKISPSTNSIMPEGLAAGMTSQEFRDLLAFLLNDQRSKK